MSGHGLFDYLGLTPGDCVAVLAPHPDDFDAVGVTMRELHQSGCELHVAVLTSGASGVENGFGGAFRDAEKTAIREEEQIAACRYFGLACDRLTFLRLDEDERGHQHDDEANRARVRNWLIDRRPRAVFMPHGDDTNVAHQRTWRMFSTIARDSRLELRACLNLDAKTVTMRRDFHAWFDDDQAAWKAELLRFHASQHARNLRTRGHGFDERVLRVNREAALAAGGAKPYAEVFEVVRFG